MNLFDESFCRNSFSLQEIKIFVSKSIADRFLNVFYLCSANKITSWCHHSIDPISNICILWLHLLFDPFHSKNTEAPETLTNRFLIWPTIL